MKRESVDVAVLGGGFGGAMTALFLQRIGLSTAMIDRGEHPRFAIGESSTPIADYVLSELCRKYSLSELAPLCCWGPLGKSMQRTPQQHWSDLLSHYPSLAEQFAQAQLVAPPQGLIQTSRLQRRVKIAAGMDWALLPSTAGFIDPLHSTGIAHTLCGVERLTAIFANHWRKPDRAHRLREYDRVLGLELAFIDDLVSGGYQNMRDFPQFIAASMLYFAAATTYENKRV